MMPTWKPIEEFDGIKLLSKQWNDQIFEWCVAPQGVEPGQSKSFIRETEKQARQVYRELLWGFN